jgi:hypothetical protein
MRWTVVCDESYASFAWSMLKMHKDVSYLTDDLLRCLINGTPMLLKEIPDWSKLSDISESSVLKSARSSQLGLFAVLEFESEGVREFRVIEVGSDKSEKVLSLLNANIGRSLHDIGQLAVDF